MPDPNDTCGDLTASAVAATRAWLHTIVIGENFCPFAKREFERNTIQYRVEHTCLLQSQIDAMLDECHKMLADDSIETSLVIFTDSARQGDLNTSQFDNFLLLIDAVQWAMQRAGFEGELQLATFHPDYLFEGEAADSPSHYTNRSPYPTLHLIREASIERVLKTYKMPESIPERNVEHAMKLGTHFFEAFLNSLRTAD